eukprot:314451-Alexandrium_andersonii.AAC.1
MHVMLLVKMRLKMPQAMLPLCRARPTSDAVVLGALMVHMTANEHGEWHGVAPSSGAQRGCALARVAWRSE